jgi:hypothetical protein
LGKILRANAREPSFQDAAKVLADLAEVIVSIQQANRVAQEFGQELQTDRDRHVD